MGDTETGATDDEPRWNTIAHAAIYADVNDRTMRRWVTRGMLPNSAASAESIRGGRVDLNDIDGLFRDCHIIVCSDPGHDQNRDVLPPGWRGEPGNVYHCDEH